MPAIPFSIKREDGSSISDAPAEGVGGGAGSSDPNIWLIVGIVLGTALLAIVFVAAVLTYYKRKWYLEEKERDPYLSRKEFLRRRKMSAIARQEEEELQRNIMIRKSLASRSDISTHTDADSLDVEEGLPSGLKEDWKEWEARMRRESSSSTTNQQHPLLSAVPALPSLPLPSESGSRSPSRSPLLRGQSPPPITPLPRLVSFQSSTVEKAFRGQPMSSKRPTSRTS